MKALGWSAKTDEPILILEAIDSNLDRTLEGLSTSLTAMPDVRLLVIDHLGKVLKVKDFSEYKPVMAEVKKSSRWHGSFRVSTS